MQFNIIKYSIAAASGLCIIDPILVAAPTALIIICTPKNNIAFSDNNPSL